MNGKRPESYDFIRTAVMLAGLASLALICGYFVVTAFNISSTAGVRSAAGILLPLVVGGFVAVFNRKFFEKASSVPFFVAFVLALLFGVGVMLLIRNLDTLRAAPIAELVVASGLSVFLYAPGAMPGLSHDTARNETWMAYYFGMVSGMLGYVVFMGFPFAAAS